MGGPDLTIVLGYGPCCSSGAQAQSAEAFVEGEGLSPAAIAEALGFGSLEEFADWLSTLPPQEIAAVLGLDLPAPG